MSRTVTALYTSREEAEQALLALRQEVSLAHGEVYDRNSEDTSALERLDLTPEERESCERTLASGDHMLLAQVRSGEDPDHIVAVLERIAGLDERSDFDTPETGTGTGTGTDAEAVGAGVPVAEERVPVIEEELRIGTREVVRGGARVRTRVEEVPVQQEVELLDEHTSIERRPATRFISEAELDQGGLLRERVIEIAQIREEAVVTKEAFVREEVLVTKSIERRVEQINETVRRTEVETEELPGGSARGYGETRDGRSDFSR